MDGKSKAIADGGKATVKRITVPISPDIDQIRERLKKDTGVEMTYVQLFNFLIHFYVERANEPKTKWKSLL